MRSQSKIESLGAVVKTAAAAAATAAALAACGVETPEPTEGKAVAHVGSTSAIPTDGACAHITAERLSDFARSEYRGPLAGASFEVDPGEVHVTAEAYAAPCNQAPAEPPWIATEQITTFAGGANVLVLDFHPSASVVIQPQFETEGALVVRPGSERSLLRNGEDAAGPGFALDGWGVSQIALPPAVPSQAPLFSMRGQGGMTTAPRGLARLPDGTFLAQPGEYNAPLRAFSASGALLGSWPVVYQPGQRPGSYFEGIEAVDASHLVRAASSLGGSADGAIELLELGADTNGAPVLLVTEQIALPAPFAEEYVLGVAKVGASYAVSLLVGAGSELILVGADGALVAGPVSFSSYADGLFDAGDGRLGVLDYDGALSMHEAGDLAPRPGETAAYNTSLQLGFPYSLAWAGGQFLLLTQDKRLAQVAEDFSSFTELPLDLSGYQRPAAMDYLIDSGQIAIADRILPIGPGGVRAPRVDLYNRYTLAPEGAVTLAGVAPELRLFSLAHTWYGQQFVSHYRLASNAANPIDSVLFVHALDGSLASRIDLRPHGIRRVLSVNYLWSTHELLVTATDITGAVRLVATSVTGVPRRSYRTDAVLSPTSVSDLAQVPNHPNLPDIGLVTADPGAYVRFSLE